MSREKTETHFFVRQRLLLKNRHSRSFVGRGPKVPCTPTFVWFCHPTSFLIGRKFIFRLFRRRLFPVGGRKKGKRPVSFTSHRAGKHHPSPPPPITTTLLRDASFSLFLSSVRRSAALRSEESGVRLSSDRVPFFCAHVFTRSHAVAFPHVSGKIKD